jgi:DNA-binding transcriptional regulator YiaG
MDASRPTPHPVKAVLATRRLSNRWLAQATGLNEKYLSSVINGDRPPGARCRQAVAAALRLPETTLWDFDQLGLNPALGKDASGRASDPTGIVGCVSADALPTGVAAVQALARLRSMCSDGRARQIRVQLDIDLAELAGAIDVEPQRLYRWETDRARPTGDAALRYLQALDALAPLTITDEVPA